MCKLKIVEELDNKEIYMLNNLFLSKKDYNNLEIMFY